MKRFAAIGLLWLVAWGVPQAWALTAIPPLTARVTDLTGTLSGEAVNRLESSLAAFEAKKGSQIAVLIVPTTQPEDVEQFGIRVADQWKLGRKGIDDGAILLIAKNDRRVRIEVGRGLEGVLPDALASRIIADTITPHFKLGDYDGGVEAGVTQILSVVEGEPLPEPDRQWEHRSRGLGGGLPLLLGLAFVVGSVLRSVFGRVLGSLAAGICVAGAGWLLTHTLLLAAGAGVLGFLFAVCLGSSRMWLAGGGGWSGFGGRSGGGGFSGGGGGFSGGGASGSW